MKVALTKLKNNPKNPRVIRDEKFNKLKKSIEEFPDMLEKRPLVVFTDKDGKFVVLGGNMRLKAAKELGIKELPVIVADEWTEEQKAQFLIKDNVNFGEWNHEELANEWDAIQLQEWGLDLPVNLDIDEDIIEKNDIEEYDEKYTNKVATPIYEPSNEKPEIIDVFDVSKYQELLSEIQKSNLNQKEKDFLKYAATRHIVFNYAKIADLYAHSSDEMQSLMEKSALVIIDFEKAIENGFVQLSKDIQGILNNEE
jgi:hypothetical protein